MAVTQVLVDTPDGLTRYENTDVDAVSGVKGAAGTIHSIIVDNTLNAAITYLKMWNVASGSVTFGTTSPDYIIQIPASVKRSIVFPEGLAFTVALSVAASTTAALAGVTAPTSSVPLQILYV